jgi:hypothetical protein
MSITAENSSLDWLLVFVHGCCVRKHIFVRKLGLIVGALLKTMIEKFSGNKSKIENM